MRGANDRRMNVEFVCVGHVTGAKAVCSLEKALWQTASNPLSGGSGGAKKERTTPKSKDSINKHV